MKEKKEKEEKEEKREQATRVEVWSRGPQPPLHAGVYGNHHARQDTRQGSASARIIKGPVHCAKVFSGVTYALRTVLDRNGTPRTAHTYMYQASRNLPLTIEVTADPGRCGDTEYKTAYSSLRLGLQTR